MCGNQSMTLEICFICWPYKMMITFTLLLCDTSFSTLIYTDKQTDTPTHRISDPDKIKSQLAVLLSSIDLSFHKVNKVNVATLCIFPPITRVVN